jgi:hypothetical protein
MSGHAKALAMLAIALTAAQARCEIWHFDPRLNSSAIPAASGLQFLDAEIEYSTSEITFTDPRDRHGLRRDTRYFLGYQLASITVLYALPESVSGWTDEQKSDYSLSIWWDNVTHPRWDTDDFYLNYILHPYWGSAYYVRAQERGFSASESFWYSATLSALYEFGAEALFEQPSIQDLIVTPVAGSLLGKYFMGVRSNIREREVELGYRKTSDKWLWVLTDPLGSLNGSFDRLFGWDESKLYIQPYYADGFQLRRTPFEADRRQPDQEFGLRFYAAWQ